MGEGGLFDDAFCHFAKLAMIERVFCKLKKRFFFCKVGSEQPLRPATFSLAKKMFPLQK